MQQLNSARVRSRVAATVLAALTCGGPHAQEHEHGHAMVAAAACAAAAEPSVRCGQTPTPAFDARGRLWVAFEQAGTIYVTMSADSGQRFSAPVAVNGEPEPIDINGENRPKIAFGRHNEIYVSWTRKVAGGYNGTIRFTRSIDGGGSFEPVRTVNDDGLVTGHRFETLFVDSRGEVYLSWLDKRDLVAAGERGAEYTGAAVYYTVSSDDGVTFVANRRVAPESCECCRIAAAETPSGDVALFFRDVFDQHIRDHGFAIVGATGVLMPAIRATEDDWRIDACPHHGPAMIGAGDGTYQLAWFTGGAKRQGVYYGRFDPGQRSLTQVVAVSANPTAGHPTLDRVAGELLLAWKEFDGERTQVYLMRSQDGGRTWSPREAVVSTSGGSDHPFIVDDDARAFLTWHTSDEGLRVVALTDEKVSRR